MFKCQDILFLSFTCGKIQFIANLKNNRRENPYEEGKKVQTMLNFEVTLRATPSMVWYEGAVVYN